MNTTRILLFLILVGLLLVASAPVGARHASPLLDLSWTVVGAGGGHAASVTYGLDATSGQPIVGSGSGAMARLAAGFWQDLTGYRVYLPLVIR